MTTFSRGYRRYWSDVADTSSLKQRVSNRRQPSVAALCLERRGHTHILISFCCSEYCSNYLVNICALGNNNNNYIICTQNGYVFSGTVSLLQQ